MTSIVNSFCAALVALSACAPSRAEIFDPVSAELHRRGGLDAEWRDGSRRSAATERKLAQILAAPLDADGAALVAVLVSPDLQAAYAELEAAGGRLGRARAPSNPQVIAELRLPISEGAHDEVELSAVESVTDLIALFGRADEANARLEAARRRATGATLAVAARARTAFYTAVAAEQTVALEQEIAEAASASAELAHKLRAAGNITELMATREEVFAEEARLAARGAEGETAVAREHLLVALGLTDADPAARIASELPAVSDKAPPVDDLEGTATAASLELAALRSDLDAAGERIGVARWRSWLPDLGVGVSAKREQDGWGLGPMIALSLPIFDWGQGERAAAWAELHREQAEVVSATLELRARARAAAVKLAVAHERVLAMRTRLLPMRARIVDEAKKQADAMAIDPFELLLLRRQQLEGEVAAIAALRDYWLAATEVEQLRSGAGRIERTTEEDRR